MAGFTAQRRNMLGARLMSPIGLSMPNRNALSGQQARQMSHGSSYGQTTPQGNRAIAENAENKRKIAIQEEYYRLQAEDPDRFAQLPPLPDLMREPSAWDRAMAPFTGPDTNQNASNAMTTTLGAQFAGGLIPAAKQIQTKGIMSLLDPRMSPGQVNMMTYHGSPHRINNVDDANPMGKFDLGKIGTGEGAQAYGHGIYLAESQGVAKSYSTMGGTPFNAADGKRVYDPAFRMPGVVNGPNRAADALETAFQNQSSNPYAEAATQVRRFGDGDTSTEAVRLLGEWEAKGVTPGESGHLYEVDLPDEHIAKMLDWDAPLSEQPQAVRDAVKQMPGEIRALFESADYAGNPRPMSESYLGLSKYLGSGDIEAGKAIASDELMQLGIPGIKYLDGNSRTSGEGTRNFVAFDPEIAKILSRNGERAALPMDEASRMAFPDEVKSIKGEPVRALNEARAATKANPVEVYHSTGADFTEFDSEKGIGGQLWFTSSADKAKAGYDGAAGSGRTITASVDIRNPAGWDEYDKFGTDELMGRGYDGLKLEGSDGEVTYVAFFPEQVKVKSNAANKSVSGIGGLGAGGLMSQDEQKPKRTNALRAN
jgi:hypothetical protein